MTQLTLEAARALLGDAYGISEREPLFPCQVNFFEPGVLALPPGALAMVRQDMLGRRHTHRFPLDGLADFAMVSSRRKLPALRFKVEGVVWQLDGLAEEHFGAVIRHVSRTPMDVDEEVEELDELDLEPVIEEERAPRAVRTDAPRRAADAGAPQPPPMAHARPSRPTPAQPLPARPASGRLTPVDEILGYIDEAVATGATLDRLVLLLQKLFVQCIAMEQTDRALLTAQSLLALGKARAAEQQLVARYLTQRMLQADGALTAEHWDALDELEPADRALGSVTAALAPALVRMTARSPRDYGLKSGPEGTSQLLFGRIFTSCCRVCSLLELYWHPLPDGPKGIAFANLSQGGAWTPTLVVGADLLAGRSEVQLAFRIGHEISFLRREHLLRVLLPSLAQQALLVLTAVALAVPDRPIPGEEEEAIRAQRSLLTRYMEIEDFERLSASVRRLLAATQPFDLARWNRAVERSSLRVGLLLCGDVQVACQMVTELVTSPQDAERARVELIRFAVGNLHQRLRRDLRLAVA